MSAVTGASFGMPAHSVGVGHAVGDVEPAEVVVEVALAVDVVPQQPLAHRGRHGVEQAIDARPRRASAAPAASAASVRSDPSSAASSRPSSSQCGSGDAAASASVVEVELGEAAMEQLHVRQLVLAGAVHDRRHEVRQHGVGPLPAQPLEQLERLLGVDRAVAVREQVIRHDVGEPRPDVARRRSPVRSRRAAPPARARAPRPRPAGGTRPAGRRAAPRSGSGSGLTGRSRSSSATPAIACTIGSARSSPA